VPWPAGRSSPPSARRCTAGTATSEQRSAGPATGAGPTTTATPQAEALAVQREGGLIDVSTLGKLLVLGPDAGELLDRLYPNRMSNLAPGRIRYGVMLSDAGRITDDGTVCRIDDETFYVTTTSAGAAAVEQRMTWWLTAWDLDVRVTDVTQGVAAMNLAGPKAREVLGELTTWTARTPASPTSTRRRPRWPACRR
jgi:sarcosine oxidase subunit alpha